MYRPLLSGWLRQKRLTDADSDDVVQEVMVVVMRRLAEFEHNGRPGAFRNWLRQVLVNGLRQHWRRQKPSSLDAEAMLDQLTDPNSDLSRAWNEDHDRFVLARLLDLVEGDFEPKTWSAFRRVVIDGVPVADVATELDMKVNTVLHAKSRIMRRLRDERAVFLE